MKKIHPKKKKKTPLHLQDWSLETIDDQIEKCILSHALKLHLIKEYLSPAQAESLPVNMPSIKYLRTN